MGRYGFTLLTFKALVAAFLVFALATSAPAQTAFYDADAGTIAAGQPGTLIRNEKKDVTVYGGSKYRVLYRSVGLKGEPIAVSGMVFVPPGAPPKGGWPIVAWAHPTSGLVSKCAPSLANFGTSQVQGLEAMLKQGYVVTATDYPGLGTPGPHPYLVGDSEGRAVLDSIRAARELVGGSSPYAALWGHSQGGQAVLFAAQLAAQYAPDVKLLGVAAAAPATKLGELMDNDISTPGGKNLLGMTLYSWAKVYDTPLDGVVTPSGLKTIDGLAQVCSESIVDVPARYAAGQALMKSFLAVDDITDLEPWKDFMDENTVGTLPADLPVMLVQGAADDTVEPAVTASYMQELCKAGSSVAMLTIPKVGHLEVAMRGSSAVIDWLGNLAAGEQTTNSCHGS